MEDIIKENLLQVTDHWVTIIAGAFTVILTIIAVWLAFKTYILTKRDKEKNIAIKELQNQTKELRNLYMLSIQPRFSIEIIPNLVLFKNVGGDCFDIEISPQDERFDNFPESMASKSLKKVSAQISGIYEFTFKDALGNRYRQTYNSGNKHMSNLEQINTPEEL